MGNAINVVTIAVAVLFSQLSGGDLVHEFTVGKDTYTLNTSPLEVTTWTGREQLVRYSVYKNGTFLHGRGRDSGRFFSCPVDNPVDLKSIHSEERQIGWMLIGGGICGNTYSHNIELIIPSSSEHSPGYESHTFLAKTIPNLIPTANGAAVCFFEQNWGRGGTAASFFVPNKLLIEKHSIRKGNVFDNLHHFELKPGQPGSGTNSFLGLFVAGIEAVDPELMRYAIDQHYDEEDQDWYDIHFNDGSLEGVKALVTKVEIMRSLCEEVDSVVSWDLIQNRR